MGAFAPPRMEWLDKQHCIFPGIIGVVGAIKKNSCLIGFFAAAYFINVVIGIFASVLQMSTVPGLRVPDVFLTILVNGLLLTIGLYWSLCLYSFWVEINKGKKAKEVLDSTSYFKTETCETVSVVWSCLLSANKFMCLDVKSSVKIHYWPKPSFLLRSLQWKMFFDAARVMQN